MKRSELKDLIRTVIEESSVSQPANLPFTIYDSEGVPQESFATREDAEAALTEWEDEGESSDDYEIVEEGAVSESTWNEEDVEVKEHSEDINVRMESNVETNEYKLFVEDELICTGEFGGAGVVSVEFERNSDELDLVNTIYYLLGSNFK